MKFAVLALTFLFAVSQLDARYLATEETTEEVDVDEQECVKELNIKDEDGEDPAKVDAMTVCYFSKKGLMLPNGDINYDGMLEEAFEAAIPEDERNSLAAFVFKNKFREAAEECRQSPPETNKSVTVKFTEAMDCIKTKVTAKMAVFGD